LYSPDTQSVHSVEAVRALEILPTPHFWQPLEPEEGAKKPALHAVHVEEPEREKKPASQVLHEEDSSEAENLPLSQLEHSGEESRLYFPASHM
jgi:hypothetical protein